MPVELLVPSAGSALDVGVLGVGRDRVSPLEHATLRREQTSCATETNFVEPYQLLDASGIPFIHSKSKGVPHALKSLSRLRAITWRDPDPEGVSSE